MMLLISCFTSILFLASKTSESENHISTVREQHQDDDSSSINNSFDFYSDPTTGDASQTECSNYLRYESFGLSVISKYLGNLSYLWATS